MSVRARRLSSGGPGGASRLLPTERRAAGGDELEARTADEGKRATDGSLERRDELDTLLFPGVRPLKLGGMVSNPRLSSA
jgi:hypothetical protein